MKPTIQTLRGDLYAALSRGPFDAMKNIIRKMHGLPEGVDNG